MTELGVSLTFSPPSRPSPVKGEGAGTGTPSLRGGFLKGFLLYFGKHLMQVFSRKQIVVQQIFEF